MMAIMESIRAQSGVNNGLFGLLRPVFSQPGVERADRMLMLGGYG